MFVCPRLEVVGSKTDLVAGGPPSTFGVAAFDKCDSHLTYILPQEGTQTKDTRPILAVRLVFLISIQGRK